MRIEDIPHRSWLWSLGQCADDQLRFRQGVLICVQWRQIEERCLERSLRGRKIHSGRHAGLFPDLGRLFLRNRRRQRNNRHLHARHRRIPIHDPHGDWRDRVFRDAFHHAAHARRGRGRNGCRGLRDNRKRHRLGERRGTEWCPRRECNVHDDGYRSRRRHDLLLCLWREGRRCNRSAEYGLLVLRLRLLRHLPRRSG